MKTNITFVLLIMMLLSQVSCFKRQNIAEFSDNKYYLEGTCGERVINLAERAQIFCGKERKVPMYTEKWDMGCEAYIHFSCVPPESSELENSLDIRPTRGGPSPPDLIIRIE